VNPINCAHCGISFIPDKSIRLYCSKPCYYAAARTRVEIQCAHCGKLTKKTPVDIGRGAKYCSLGCYWSASSTGRTRVYAKKYPNGRHVNVECQNCSAPIKIARSLYANGAGRYCSRDCYVDSLRTPHNTECEVCGKSFARQPGHRHVKRYCSWECRSIGMRGEGNPRWHGRNNAYRGWNWDADRIPALERDGYACRHCGSTDDLCVHHVTPWHLTHDNSLDNLLTLCRSCHSRVHYEDGRSE
jgi:phage terminase large subunit GpA-like protein